MPRHTFVDDLQVGVTRPPDGHFAGLGFDDAFISANLVRQSQDLLVEAVILLLGCRITHRIDPP
jgi:hypothetical protein